MKMEKIDLLKRAITTIYAIKTQSKAYSRAPEYVRLYWLSRNCLRKHVVTTVQTTTKSTKRMLE